MDFKKEVIKILQKNTKLNSKEITKILEVPPDYNLGDYAFPCFILAKKLKEDPNKIAEDLSKKIKLNKNIEKIENKGPYLNFFINKYKLTEKTLTEIYQKNTKYGSINLGKNKTIVMDYSHPNIAKPFGIGHLRSTVIGNSLYKIFKFLGYKPIGVNHLGDWGTQFGKLIVAYKKWGKKEELEKDPIKHLLKIYVKFHKLAEKNNKLNEEARRWFKKLEDGNKEALALWEVFRKLSLQEFNRIYNLLDISFDSWHGESYYNKIIRKVIKDIQKKNLTKISEGALIVNLDKYNMPPLILRKSDQATTYAARDIAAALHRIKKYKPEKIIYIVGSEQQLHFKQLFKVLELMKIKEEFVHVDFGLMKFPEGKMSTRKGNVIFLEEVLNKSIKLALKIINKKNPNLKEKEKVAKEIGIGAIIFGDLSNDRIKDINFDWKKILNFEGETAPYIQYSHARACSILKKANRGISLKINFKILNQEEEIKIIKLLSEFQEIIIKSSICFKPHILANYLIKLSQQFNEFYTKYSVLSDMKHIEKARLLLVFSVKQVIENGLNLLGIKAPEAM